jgi:exodeoxyribonuclease VII large subunit
MVDRYKNALSIYANTLNLLSPLSTLSRGYSITTNVENQVLSSIENIDKNQMISTRLSSGIIHSKVVKIEKN